MEISVESTLVPVLNKPDAMFSPKQEQVTAFGKSFVHQLAKRTGHSENPVAIVVSRLGMSPPLLNCHPVLDYPVAERVQSFF